jgi:anti-anti-sigma factor
VSFAPLHCDQRHRPDGVLELVFSGELDHGTAPFARRAIEVARDDAAAGLVIDVAGVASADAFGLAVLLRARYVHGARLRNASPAVAALLRETDSRRGFAA